MNNVAQLGAAMPQSKLIRYCAFAGSTKHSYPMTTFNVWVLVILLFPLNPLLNDVVGHESSFASFDNVFIAPMAL
ncbi:hypothetical protein [Synechococcus sp. KORDI-52]|uniref:hypothetical protein n=1 Tax=Synechococcus sp. KORDI-52 TaxID=585425 RepID=UPI000B226E07|nr:hypothetical protein [Synechococcus sp. KORDI-52]